MHIWMSVAKKHNNAGGATIRDAHGLLIKVGGVIQPSLNGTSPLMAVSIGLHGKHTFYGSTWSCSRKI